MFKTPRKDKGDVENRKPPLISKHQDKGDASDSSAGNLLVCGTYLQIDKWNDNKYTLDKERVYQDYFRIRGGQGWIPRKHHGKASIERIPRPEVRLGSVWFRVMSQRGIKVRVGPSRKATSIKSDDNVYFRFDCGEFLRSSEVLTFFGEKTEPECWAKLYRNKHVRLNNMGSEYRLLPSLTAPAEWVQVFAEGSHFLQECKSEPHIQRHRGGWRYSTVSPDGIAIRKGPSFKSELAGPTLNTGESILVTERVTPAGEHINWLRLKDGRGWVHDLDEFGRQVMAAQSLLDRAKKSRANSGVGDDKDGDAYKTIMTRLFHNDGGGAPSAAVKSTERRLV
mmetsp:Transcript_38246/g.53862  ORF Transcript_38246/g.53862 Transcript_38246/m.53862 type:complete len:337 (+) Transcript_38246:68-1078(+)